MKLIYKGKYNGDPATLPHGEHMTNAVKFKEFGDSKTFGIIMNVIAVVVTIVCVTLMFVRTEVKSFDMIGIGAGIALLTLLPHELLHAIFFKKEVYFYHDLKSGLLFVTGPETISKLRYIIMGIFPNAIFGFIPYIIFLMNPRYIILGAVAIGMGVGDYYNIYNVIIQMPKSARLYMYEFNNYWYMPIEQSNEVHND